jgi:hypothetical protein
MPKVRGMPELLEGHARFCRGCGHDLLGLSGQRCPRCGRVSPALVYRPRPPGNGRWLVLGLLAAGTALALVGIKFRRLAPVSQPAGATTAPALTQPATHSTPAPARVPRGVPVGPVGDGSSERPLHVPPGPVE